LLKSAVMPLGAPSVHSTMILRAPGSSAACNSSSEHQPSAVPVLLPTPCSRWYEHVGSFRRALEVTSGPSRPVGGFVPQSAADRRRKRFPKSAPDPVVATRRKLVDEICCARLYGRQLGSHGSRPVDHQNHQHPCGRPWRWMPPFFGKPSIRINIRGTCTLAAIDTVRCCWCRPGRSPRSCRSGVVICDPVPVGVPAVVAVEPVQLLSFRLYAPQ